MSLKQAGAQLRPSTTAGTPINPFYTPNVVGQSPLLLFVSDFMLFLRIVIPRFFHIMFPQRSLTSIFDDISPVGVLFQTFLTVYSLVLIVPLVLLGICVGGAAPLVAAWALSYPFQAMQGSALVHVPLKESPVRGKYTQDAAYRATVTADGYGDRRRTATSAQHYPRASIGEAWFWINGMVTSRSGHLLELRRLEEMFNRPFIGILNRSMGPIIDGIECVIQRDLALNTRDVREGYLELRAALEATNTTKVVLMTHSQGCIIGSLIMDLLLSTVSRDVLSKLEVYTFANASNHFSNPINAEGQPTIRHVEHYANGKDPIAQFGVLLFASEAQKTAAKLRKKNKRMGISSDDDDAPAVFSFDDSSAPITLSSTKAQANNNSTIDPNTLVVNSAAGQYFSGRLFVRWKHSGHLLISHYLGKDNNILDTKEAKRHSRLRQYLNGGSPNE